MAADATDEPRRELGAPVLRRIVSRQLPAPDAALGGWRAVLAQHHELSPTVPFAAGDQQCPTAAELHSRVAVPRSCTARADRRYHYHGSRVADGPDGPRQPVHPADTPAGEWKPDIRPARSAQCGLSLWVLRSHRADFGRWQSAPAPPRGGKRQHAERRHADLDAQCQSIAHPDRDRDRIANCRQRPAYRQDEPGNGYAEGSDPDSAEHYGLCRRPLPETQFRYPVGLHRSGRLRWSELH